MVIENTDEVYQALLTELPWKSDVVTLFGKTHITTRQTVWMGESNTTYQYSGQSHQAIAWSATVFHMKQYVEQQLSNIGINVDLIAACLTIILLVMMVWAIMPMMKKSGCSANHRISIAWCHTKICFETQRNYTSRQS